MHTVYLDAFYMDKYPVTIKRYTEFLNATDYREPDWDKVEGYFPINEQSLMICVSWHDAMAYASGRTDPCRRRQNGKKQREAA